MNFSSAPSLDRRVTITRPDGTTYKLLESDYLKDILGYTPSEIFILQSSGKLARPVSISIKQVEAASSEPVSPSE